MKRSLALLLILCGIGCSSIASAGGPTVTYIYTDGQGSPVAEADSAGNVTATFDYTPFGTTLLSTQQNAPGYTGHVADPDTSLTYMQARYYDSSIGQFLSVDPVTPSAGKVEALGTYAYAENNPATRTDPDGRWTEQKDLTSMGYIVHFTDPQPSEGGSGGNGGDGSAGQKQGGQSQGPGNYNTPYNEDWFANVDQMGNPGGGNEVGGAGITAGVAGFGVLATGGIAYDAAGGAEGISSGASALRKNITIDGPSPGARYMNGRIVGVRWKQSQWGIRLDIHPLKGDPTNTPVLHLNVGPLGRGEAGHIILFDPRWFGQGKK